VHATDGGDQSVGRALSMLNPTTAELSTLPPRFRSADIQSIKWEELLVDFVNFSKDFKIIVPYLIASVVYHSDYILNKLPKDHPIFVSRFWRSGSQVTLRSRVMPPVRMHCSETGMQASGVAVITQVFHKFDTFSEDLVQRVNETHAASQPITKEDLNKFEQNMYTNLKELAAALTANNSSIQEGTSTIAVSSSSSASSSVNNTTINLPYANWTWGGEFGRPLPEGEVFPNK
jgi:hypothetical protein